MIICVINSVQSGTRNDIEWGNHVELGFYSDKTDTGSMFYRNKARWKYDNKNIKLKFSSYAMFYTSF